MWYGQKEEPIRCDECDKDLTNEKKIVEIDGTYYCMECLENLSVEEWVKWLGGRVINR